MQCTARLRLASGDRVKCELEEGHDGYHDSDRYCQSWQEGCGYRVKYTRAS